MSTRERWIVYPLLFMTLGIALRDKVTNRVGNLATQVEAGAIVTPQLQCKELRVERVVCDRLLASEQVQSKQVVSEQVQSRRLISEQAETGQSECRTLVVKAPNNQPAVVATTDPKTQAGIVETLSAGGLPQVQLHSGESGGMVTTINPAGKRALILGDMGQEFGVFAKLPGVGPLITLTLSPWQFESKPAVPKPGKEPPAKP